MVSEDNFSHVDFLKIDFIFLSSFKIHSKIELKVQRVPKYPCPQKCKPPPLTSNIPHHRGIVVTTYEPTWTHRYCSGFTVRVHIRVYSECCTSYGFGQMYNDKYLPLSIKQSGFTALKILWVPPFILIPSLKTPRNHWPFYCLHSFAFSRMSCGWNHKVAFSDQLLSLSNMHLHILHAFDDLIVLNNITLCGCTTVYLFT